MECPNCVPEWNELGNGSDTIDGYRRKAAGGGCCTRTVFDCVFHVNVTKNDWTMKDDSAMYDTMNCIVFDGL